MNDKKIAIRVRNLGKKYTLGGSQEQYLTLRDAIVNSVKAPFKRFNRASPDQGFWALNNVSFDVEQGEVVGIIGRNGAGKSTLLKILSRITAPTEGTVELHGRVGSLLEVGTGFHPEMTGRENIFLNGSILGMKKVEIEQKFDEIVKFAEIEKFLDTPVKRYSSGMYVRLAFAVAAHLEPEILVVDEVLAVGDAAFQKKCLGKMGEVAKEGRTVLFVSHNMSAISSLCNRTILLDTGTVIQDGNASKVIQEYLSSNITFNGEKVWQNPNERPGNENIRLYSLRLISEKGNAQHNFDIGEDIKIEVKYNVLTNGIHPIVSIVVKSQSGEIVFASLNMQSENIIEDSFAGKEFQPGVYTTVCILPKNFFNTNTYTIDLHLALNLDILAVCIQDIISFTIFDFNGYNSTGLNWKGVVHPKFMWITSQN